MSASPPQSFEQFFSAATAGQSPFAYQRRLAEGEGSGEVCTSRLIDVPTGCGKTAAVVLAWLWNRVQLQRTDWPRRLVYCLPMRTLVQQTREAVKGWLERTPTAKNVGLHILMGGEEAGDWDMGPERDAVLIGTQDMLLSRALNRGYGLSRYRWPMHYGLLNSDCLWVMDETQLMGPGLWTSSQMDWMRQDLFRSVIACPTWWMSATIRPAFLKTKDRLASKSLVLGPEVSVGNDPALAHLTAAERPCSFWQPPADINPAPKGGPRQPARVTEGDPVGPFLNTLAADIAAQHQSGTLTLAVCNQVRTARRLADAVRARYVGPDEIILLTSRFRPGDRRGNEAKLIAYERQRKDHASGKGPPATRGLICISTQVVEAGMDISARRLWSEVAPWSSVIQRLGRLNRDGKLNGDAAALFWRLPLATKVKGGERIGPYLVEDLDRAGVLLGKLADICTQNPRISAAAALVKLNADPTARREVDAALQPKPEPFPRALDLHGLFSTEPDVFGGFTDISPYVRGSDPNADLTVFWREWDPKHRLPVGDDLTGPAFTAEEGCPVPVYELEKLLGDRKAYLWDPKRETWEPARAADLCPGMVVLLPASAGGYRPEAGWTGARADRPGTVPPPGPLTERLDEDPFSAPGQWVELSVHLRDAETAAKEITGPLPLGAEQKRSVITAAAFHDVGKSIGPWLAALPQPTPNVAPFWAKGPHLFKVRLKAGRAEAETLKAIRSLLAEAPGLRLHQISDSEESGRLVLRWHTSKKPDRALRERLEAVPGVDRARIAAFRPGLRHEVASALSLWHRYYRAAGAAEFSALTIYLVAAHHGKARTVLSSRHPDGQDVCGVDRATGALPYPIPTGMPLDFSGTADGAEGTFAEDGFHFQAPGWTGLVGELLGPWEAVEATDEGAAVPSGEPRSLGPFTVAYLETLVRAADERASAQPSEHLDV